jgi:large subunit ribosomal protein L10
MSVLEQKKQLVSTIADQLRNSKATIFVDYRGLDVAEVTELRKQLRDAGITFKVYKNTMTRRAAEEAELGGLDLQRSLSVMKRLLLQLRF